MRASARQGDSAEVGATGDTHLSDCTERMTTASSATSAKAASSSAREVTYCDVDRGGGVKGASGRGFGRRWSLYPQPEKGVAPRA